MKTLEESRMEIDELDAKLVELLARRIYATAELAAAKKAQGLPLYDQMREDLLMRRVRQLAGPSYEESVSRIYETIVNEEKQMFIQRFMDY
ncbi:MAG: chorismate mutase [Lachnospiraceae bacterium]|nr:chorismate mutase [Lachnospiraceae bacterium]